jgi:hypothetical protein
MVGIAQNFRNPAVIHVDDGSASAMTHPANDLEGFAFAPGPGSILT